MDATDKKAAWWLANREIMPPEGAPQALDIATELAQFDPQWKEPPPSWTQGMPLGNGDFGTTIYGPPENLTFLLGKNDLWINATERSEFPPGHYADLIRLYRTGDRKGFEELTKVTHWDDGFEHYWPSHLTMGGVFRLHLAEHSRTDSYAQRLSLHEAVGNWSFSPQGLDSMWAGPGSAMTSFVSADDEVLVLRIHRDRRPLRSFTWRLGRETHRCLPPARVGADSLAAWLEQDLVKGERYALVVAQAGAPLRLTAAGRSILGESEADHESDVFFYIAAAGPRDGGDPLALARRRVEAAAAKGFDVLIEAHRRRWHAFWARSWVQCADKSVEKPWYIANYLCGSLLRPGKFSPGLQGMWMRENVPPWSNDFHGNTNIQATYHGVFGSNHMELFEPCATLYTEMLPECRRETHEFFQTEGARLPHAGVPGGYEITHRDWMALAVSISPSAWIARLFWWAYQHSLDREFLAGTAYPILRDVADFLHGLLQLSGRDTDGRYRFEPSIYGEAYGRTFDVWGTNSIYDVASLHAGLQQAADAAEVLRVDAARAAQWRQDIKDLPDLAADSEGIWTYWPEHPKNARVTNSCFFYPVYPCELVSEFHGPAKWLEPARKTWNAVVRDADAHPWCGGTTTAAAARMADAAWAFRSASKGHSIGAEGRGALGAMQYDHGPGMSLALNSMLVLGLEGTLILFPGWPTEQEVAFHSLRAPGAVLVSARMQGGRVNHVALQPLHEGPMKVLNPFDPAAWGMTGRIRVRVRRHDTGHVVMDASLGYREPLAWNGEAKVIYRLDVECVP